MKQYVISVDMDSLDGFSQGLAFFQNTKKGSELSIGQKFILGGKRWE